MLDIGTDCDRFLQIVTKMRLYWMSCIFVGIILVVIVNDFVGTLNVVTDNILFSCGQ